MLAFVAKTPEGPDAPAAFTWPNLPISLVVVVAKKISIAMLVVIESLVVELIIFGSPVVELVVGTLLVVTVMVLAAVWVLMASALTIVVEFVVVCEWR